MIKQWSQQERGFHTQLTKQAVYTESPFCHTNYGPVAASGALSCVIYCAWWMVPIDIRKPQSALPVISLKATKDKRCTAEFSAGCINCLSQCLYTVSELLGKICTYFSSDVYYNRKYPHNLQQQVPQGNLSRFSSRCNLKFLLYRNFIN